MIPRWGTSRKKVSFQFNFEIVQRETRVAQVHWKCIPGSRRCEIESSRTYSVLVFVRGTDRDLSSVTDDLRWVCTVAGCRGPTGTEVRVRGGTWTRACTVWTWCDLASRASATVDAWCLKQMCDAEAAELAWRRHGGHTVTFRAGTSDRQRGVRYSSRLGCEWGPGQASVQLPSSVNVGWCVAGVAGRNRCQPRCWRGSEASCCCRSGHRDRERTRPDEHQLHIRSLWDRRSAANGDLFPAKSTRSWTGRAVVDLSSSMTRQTWHSSTSEPSGQRRRFELVSFQMEEGSSGVVRNICKWCVIYLQTTIKYSSFLVAIVNLYFANIIWRHVDISKRSAKYMILCLFSSSNVEWPISSDGVAY